jgi:hypothetical protein
LFVDVDAECATGQALSVLDQGGSRAPATLLWVDEEPFDRVIRES